jgi:pimeloyl-ACP methyl ester carboxylesterase
MFPAGRPDLRTRYLDLTSGLRVRAVECGDDGAPIVLMLPGWGCSVYVFRENLAALAVAGLHAVAVDLKGHGLSDKPQTPAEYRVDPMRAHVVEILDALGADEVMLAGLSMGGALAAHVGASNPRRVRGVIMVSPVGFSGVSGLQTIRALTPPSVTPFLPKVAGRALIEMILTLVNGKLRRITERDVDEYWAPTQFPEFTRAMRHLLHEFTWQAPFRTLEMPTLMISGTRDRLTSRSDAETFRLTMPTLAHIAVSDAGHVVYDEAAPLVNEAMIDFFRKAMAGQSKLTR